MSKPDLQPKSNVAPPHWRFVVLVYNEDDSEWEGFGRLSSALEYAADAIRAGGIVAVELQPDDVDPWSYGMGTVHVLDQLPYPD